MCTDKKGNKRKRRAKSTQCNVLQKDKQGKGNMHRAASLLGNTVSKQMTSQQGTKKDKREKLDEPDRTSGTGPHRCDHAQIYNNSNQRLLRSPSFSSKRLARGHHCPSVLNSFLLPLLPLLLLPPSHKSRQPASDYSRKSAALSSNVSSGPQHNNTGGMNEEDTSTLALVKRVHFV